MALRDYEVLLGEKVLENSSKYHFNFWDVLTSYNLAKREARKNIWKINEMIIEIDEPALDVDYILRDLGIMIAAKEVYLKKKNSFYKDLANFLERRIRDSGLMLNLAEASYRNYIWDFEKATFEVGYARNKTFLMSLTMPMEIKWAESTAKALNMDNFKKPFVNIFDDFDDYVMEFEELIKALKVRNEEKASKTVKNIFAYMSSLNFIFFRMKGREIIEFAKNKKI